MYQSTREVAKLLGVKPDLITRSIWSGRIKPPQKSPSGSYLWTEQDIERAQWQLRRYGIGVGNDHAKP